MVGTGAQRTLSRGVMRRTRFHSLICVWAAATTATGGCRTPPTATRPAPPPLVSTAPVLAAPAASGARATVPVDETILAGAITSRTPDAQVASPDVTITDLSAADTSALLARLEPLPDLSAATAKAPAMRAASLPPPRTGPTQPIAFVVPVGKAVADGGTLPTRTAPPPPPAQPADPVRPPQILPSGDVDAEAVIRVRFDEPMVPVAAVGVGDTPAITIEPAVAGGWRWLDTRVLAFTPNHSRLAQATQFKVTVPSGIRAVSGGVLAAAAKGEFATAPVAIRGHYPSNLRPDSPIAIELDQKIDPDKLLPFLRVETVKGKPLAFRLIDHEAAKLLWANNPSLGPAPGAHLAPNTIILAPQTSWPAGTDAQVLLKAGAPSAEGPLRSKRLSSARFTVVAPFVVNGVACDELPARMVTTCSARGYMTVQMSTPVSVASFRSDKFQIDGEELEDHPNGGGSISLWTPATVGKRFTISVGTGLIDIYGQPMTGPRTIAFTVTRQRFWPSLSADTGLQILDPRFQIPQWVIYTQAVSALRVQLFQVTPDDYFAYELFEAGRSSTPPGKKILDKNYEVGRNFSADLRVDLRPALAAAGTGHVIAIATATPVAGTRKNDLPSKAIAWIQVTRLGMTARFDGEKISAWVQDISPTTSFLAPLPGVTSSLIVARRGTTTSTTATDLEGHVSFELPPRAAAPAARTPSDDDDYSGYNYRTGPSAVLVAQTPTDSVFAAVRVHEKAIRTESARWYVSDDRFLYKPSEPVYLKGWIRYTHNGVNPDLALPHQGEAVAWRLDDSRGNKIASGSAALSDQGGFDLEVALPPTVNLGPATFTLSTRTHSLRHTIKIEEFRTPAFSVSLDEDVTHAGATPLIAGESIEMTAEAKYYAGGGLAGASIGWYATLSAATYRPPGWDAFTFRPARKRGDHDSWRDSVSKSDSFKLSGASTSSIVYGIPAIPNHAPSLLTVDASVRDLDRMVIRASSRDILVHPSSYYVGVRATPRTRDKLEAVVTDIDGNPVRGVAIKLEIEGVLGSEQDRSDAKIVDTQTCDLVSGEAPATCPWKRRDLDTSYVATARIADSRGRTNSAQYDIPWYGRDDERDLSIVPDRAIYGLGDVANIEIRSKVVPATAVVTYARQGIVKQKRVELTAPSTSVELPIEPAFLQNVHVLVDRWNNRRNLRKGSTLPLPESTSAEVNLAVEVESARLVMKTRSTKPLISPGEDATFEVEVRHGDRPMANAEVAMIVVDEAVLALAGKSHADPLAPFYRHVTSGTHRFSTLGLVHDSAHQLAGVPGFVRTNLDGSMGTGTGYGVGGGRGGLRGRSSAVPSVSIGSPAVVQSRKDFRANAVFSPRLKTNADGKVSLTVKMPDNLTRYRIVALATAQTHLFGKAESTIVTQRKLNARIVAPRFLTQGDTFSVPVVVQNLARESRTIDVAVRAANLVTTGITGKRVVLPGGQRAELRFDLATQARGTGVIQAIASSGDFADASNLQIPIYEPATTESFATYGTVDDAPQFEQLLIPRNIFTDVGGVEVEMASTQLQSLTDAYWYLYAYPYECAEQRSSRMLATAALADVLDAFATPGRPTKQAIDTQIAVDIKKLERQQNHDGGWGYFSAMESDPFVSMQVVSALAAYKNKGKGFDHAVSFVTKQATQQLAELTKTVAIQAERRTDRNRLPYQVSLTATALTTLAATGVDVRARVIKLHTAATALGIYPLDAKSRVLSLLAKHEPAKAIRAKLLADLLSATHETASSATVTTTFVQAERMLLVSETKTSALALDALIREAPEHPLVTKLARGVLDARKHGRWTSTQENLAVLQTMRRYFDTYEKLTPNYTGKLWFGKAAYAEQPFIGRSTARGHAAVDWTALPGGTSHDVTIAKDGPGRMYYRVGITYAPKETKLPALDAGFIVRRTYTPVDDPKDVIKLPDGTYKVKLGARVLVSLETLNTTERFAVAVVDPLPAGFESVNTSLATSERPVNVPDDTRWDHESMRDNRSEAFVMNLAPGSHWYSYTARATTPGTFLAAPAKAEEMYSPETFGRSTGTTVIIQ